MIRPTLRAVLAFSAGIPLTFVLVAVAPSYWAMALNYCGLVLVAMVTDALLSLPSRRLAVRLDGPERIHLGEDAAVAASLATSGPARPVRIEALLELYGEVRPPLPVATILSEDGRASLALPLHPTRRGVIAVGGLWLRWQGPLGLVEIVRRDPVGHSVEVIPNLRGAKGIALQFLTRDAHYGIKALQQKGEGSEFDALREYMPGLDTRYMDWKRSARHRKLLSKEFRTERNHQIIMAFDTGYVMAEPIGALPRIDHAVNAALALSWVSLSSEDLVGFYAFDEAVRMYVPPARGLATFARLQRATAEIGYRPVATNFTLGLAELNARLNRRALVILFTEFVDTVMAELLLDSLQRIGSRHAVLFVTLKDNLLETLADKPPAGFEDVAQAVIAHDFLRERAIVLERLSRLGIHCLDVAPDDLAMSLVNRYLAIKQQGLI